MPPDQPVQRMAHLVRRVSPMRDLRALLEIIRLLRFSRPSLLHTHSSKAGFLGRWAAALLRLAGGEAPRVIHSPHGHVFYGYFGPLLSELYRLVELSCVPWTDRFVALTEGEKRESLGFGLGRPEQWAVVPSGVALPPESFPASQEGRRIRASLGLGEEEVVAGSLLRLERVKGPEVWVQASAYALRRSPQSLRFLAVGEGPLREELLRMVMEFDIADRWIFSGPTADVWAHLAAMDIYVQPSLNEGMGRALVQAQAMGLPVVATSVCGIPDVVREGASALLVPPGDPQALGEAMLELARDPERRKSMGRAGRLWVSSPDETGQARFSPEAAAARLRTLYGEVLSGEMEP